tara:strand:- start:139 stop:663 length:525 start_codon:yes stop_codon:yes gene_type:complete
MNRSILITLLLSLFTFKPSFLTASTPSVSVGMSETMGLWGLINVNYDLNIQGSSSPSNKFFMMGGIMALPFFGGAGVGWRHDFNDSLITPFSTVSAFGTYALPVMCATDNCSTSYGLRGTTSLGLDFHILKSEQRNLHLQLGVIAQYDLANLEVAEVSGNIPGISPVLNLKWGN